MFGIMRDNVEINCFLVFLFHVLMHSDQKLKSLFSGKAYPRNMIIRLMLGTDLWSADSGDLISGLDL